MHHRAQVHCVADGNSTYQVPSTPTYSSASQLASAHSDDEAVNDVTPTADGEPVPAGHVVHAPQLTGQAGLPGLTAASEHDGANSLMPQLEVHVRVLVSTCISGPVPAAVLPVMVTDDESMLATVFER